MAIKNYVSNKVSKFTRYSKNITNYEYLKEQNIELKETAKKVFGTKHILENAKLETFSQAQRRLGLSEMDIMEAYKGLCVNFYTYAFIVLALFFLLIYLLFFLKILLSSLVVLTIMGVCLANCFKYSFRSFQMKNRKLCPVSDWYESAEFLPEFPSSHMVSMLPPEENLNNGEDEILLSDDEREEIQKEIDERMARDSAVFEEKFKKQNEEYELKRKKEKEEALIFLNSLNEQYSKEDKSKGDV